MSSIIEIKNLTKQYKETTALDNISVSFNENTIYGLLGRNGAGKTTLMSIITAQNFATSGQVQVYGENPYENGKILGRICFVRESQKYPDDANAKHAFKIAQLMFENWDEGFAQELIKDFNLPMKTPIKKLSRGQLSAVGVIIGLASRADITFFDEPYLGLDAVARQVFYDRLIQDYADHPRTVILSSHLIDEITHLIEHVVVLDDGKIMLDTSVDEARQQAVTLTGEKSAVENLAEGYAEMFRESLGSVIALTIEGQLSTEQKRRAGELGIEVSPVSLQQYVVRRTQLNSSDKTLRTTGGAA